MKARLTSHTIPCDPVNLGLLKLINSSKCGRLWLELQLDNSVNLQGLELVTTDQ